MPYVWPAPVLAVQTRGRVFTGRSHGYLERAFLRQLIAPSLDPLFGTLGLSSPPQQARALMCILHAATSDSRDHKFCSRNPRVEQIQGLPFVSGDFTLHK